MSKKDNLARAKNAKNDEFYTRLEDIESEISMHPDYVRQFKDKVVFCNCDDPEWSNFHLFFRQHFQQLGLKKLITTHYNQDGSPSYKLEWNGEMLGDDCVNMIKTPLKGNGDFRSEECVEILKSADIVVTNPPFSIAREDFIPLLYQYEKQFIIIGDLNWVSYKTVFPLFKENKMFFGYSNVKSFRTPSGEFQKFGNKVWFTNLDIDKHHEGIILTKNYNGNEDKYPKYDNYDAINVNKVKDIPKDYFEPMGVPITYLSEHSPEQFEILGILQSSTEEQAGIPILREYNDFKEMRQDMTYTGASGVKANGNPVLKGKSDKGNFLYNPTTNEYVHSAYARIVIRRKE